MALQIGSNPFLHHPELEPLIDDPLASAMRKMTSASVIEQLKSAGLRYDWIAPEAEREANRHAFMSQHQGDVWVFAYGSLMWNPALVFDEVRRTHLPGYARRFILRDNQGGRGCPEAPGLMAALDEGGDGCDGLSFRIAADRADAEMRILWQREMIGPGYFPRFVSARTAHGPITCLTFVADHDAPLIEPDLTREQQIQYVATGKGFLGTSLDYLRSIARHFAALGIEDTEVTSLLIEAEAKAAA